MCIGFRFKFSHTTSACLQGKLKSIVLRAEGMGISLAEVFGVFDKDGSGFITVAELEEGLRELGVFEKVPPEQVGVATKRRSWHNYLQQRSGLKSSFMRMSTTSFVWVGITMRSRTQLLPSPKKLSRQDLRYLWLAAKQSSRRTETLTLSALHFNNVLVARRSTR